MADKIEKTADVTATRAEGETHARAGRHAAKPEAGSGSVRAKGKAAESARKAASGSAKAGKPERKAGMSAKKPSPGKKASSKADEEKKRDGDSTKAAKRAKVEGAKASVSDKKAKARGEAEKPSSGAKKRSAKRRASRKPAGLFMETGKKSGAKKGSKRKRGVRLGAADLCLMLGIVTLLALGIRQHGQYVRFLNMRRVVDAQTFYEGTTVEGVDVSEMTLAGAKDYWRERVEPRYALRTVTLDGGATVTAGELGYSSDYESVLTTAWSAGRSGSLEERYQAVAQRREHPSAYGVVRSDYDPAVLEAFVEQAAEKIDVPARDAAIDRFDAENYAFVFTKAESGRRLDREALAREIAGAIAAGGGTAALRVSEVPPEVTDEDVASRYGLITYAITNASSSNKARTNNIKLAMSFINGTCLKPGETFSFNETVGQRTVARGFKKAGAYAAGEVTEEVGGGICQVSTTLFNAAVKADMKIVERHNHSLTVAYVDKGKDATVDWDNQDFKFTNTSDDDIYICCYLTDDKRVRFGIFGKLLPNGETITLESVTTEVVKYETDYQPSSALAKGETEIVEPGRNGYKAEAYKIRWDASGNQLSKELLCKSVYKVKNEVVLYGA